MHTHRFHLASRTSVQLVGVSALLALTTACGGGGGAPATVPKTWQGAAPIETSNDNANRPQVGYVANGDALAVWNQSDGMRFNTWANRYSPGVGWRTPTLIESNDTGNTGKPQIAIDASGNALAVWEQRGAVANTIRANHYNTDTGWSADEWIGNNPFGDAYAPQIAMNASGSAQAVWQQSDGTRDNIWSNRYSPGTGWGTAVLIESNNTGFAIDPQVAMDSSGNALAVWALFDGARDNVWANRYSPAAGWGTPELIETGSSGDAGSAQVAFDASGNALAVWRQSDGMRNNIWANRYSPATGWGAAEVIETDNAGSGGNPQVAFDASGNALVVWQQSDGARTNVWSNRYSPGTGWGAAELIETNNTGDAVDPQLALESSGDATVVWSQDDGTRFNAWANRFTVSAGWGTPELIETSGTGDAVHPQVAMDGSGRALAVWEQASGTVYSIWANRYE